MIGGRKTEERTSKCRQLIYLVEVVFAIEVNQKRERENEYEREKVCNLLMFGHSDAMLSMDRVSQAKREKETKDEYTDKRCKKRLSINQDNIAD